MPLVYKNKEISIPDVANIEYHKLINSRMPCHVE